MLPKPQSCYFFFNKDQDLIFFFDAVLLEHYIYLAFSYKNKDKKERYQRIYFNKQYITVLVLQNFVNQNCTIISHIFFLLFLIDAIKHNIEKKFKTYFILLHDCLGRGGQSQAYKIKQFRFFSCYVFWRQQKLLKRNEKINSPIGEV